MTNVLTDVADVATEPPAASAAGRPLRVKRCVPTVGPAYWRWDCRACGEYGGGEDRDGAVARALRHCAEHPQHRSALLPPLRCRQGPPASHPVLLAAAPVDSADDGLLPEVSD